MMQGLRRRVVGDASPAPSSESSRQPSPDRTEKLRVISENHLKTLKTATKNTRKSFGKRRAGLLFTLGSLFGVFLAVYFVGSSEVLDLAGLLDVNLDSIFDVLPAGLVHEAKEFQKSEKDAINYDSFAVGLHARSQGVKAAHPVIMIPGVISTGLESWGTEEDSRTYFRKRLWGSWSMMRALVMDKAGWKRHIMLDHQTGLDPPGVKLRAAQGFDAADFFITGYWIWNKILENLATIGYDPNTAFTAAYDWRLAYQNLEVRDQYYTRLKNHIETAHKITGKKVALLSHSMGSQVLYYFFHWVESDQHGKGGSDWVETYVDSWINISGCMLGALKGVPAVLSGEMKDTAQLNAFAVYGLEKFLSRAERAEIFRAMPGISSMLPIGGETIWGNLTWAPDDPPNATYSYGTFINYRPGDANSTTKLNNLTVEGAHGFLTAQADKWYVDMIKDAYSYGVAHTKAEVEANQKIPSKWVNPLETRLPNAPNLKIYCFYGIGKPTERAYYYREDHDPLNKLNVTIDNGHTSGDVDHGVILGEGDGTVNLVSMGYMCSKGWKMKRYNPAGAKVVVHEMPHEPDRFSPRGGPNTGKSLARRQSYHTS